MRKPFALVLALAFAGTAFAGMAHAEPGLPDRAAVVAALDADPSVKAALARTDAARAEADGLAVGPHEVTVNAMISRRTVRGEGLDAGSYAEFEGQVTRPIRLPGKAGLDRRIGGYGVAYARNMAEDARHQAALGLAQGWWDWLDAAAQTTVDRQAVANQQRLLASVERRAALRDASRLDADQARAALGMAQTAAARSASGPRRLAMRGSSWFSSKRSSRD